LSDQPVIDRKAFLKMMQSIADFDRHLDPDARRIAETAVKLYACGELPHSVLESILKSIEDFLDERAHVAVKGDQRRRQRAEETARFAANLRTPGVLEEVEELLQKELKK
jgi:heme oxygenase